MALKNLNYINKIKRFTNLNTLSGIKNEIDHIIKYPKQINSFINGKELYSDNINTIRSPIYKNCIIGKYSLINDFDIDYKKAKNHWSNIPFSEKIDIFENIANLIENKYYNKMMAATIINQGKDPYQAEIDSIGELVDFIRFNCKYAEKIISNQPISTDLATNISEYNPLGGFVSSITPFNFTAIAGNLALTPLLFGNVVYWKPSFKSLVSNKLFLDICLEANIPPEIINFIIMDPEEYSNKIINNPDLNAVIFTGASNTFMNIQKQVNSNIDNYNNNIRFIGETGGKNFHFIDSNCDIENAINETIYSSFDYSGQKCSACSRLYLPESIETDFIDGMIDKIKNINFENYGVIDLEAYNQKIDFLDKINSDSEIELIHGANYNNKSSYFIEPTICKISNTNNWIWNTELFAPIITYKTYQDSNIEKAMDECSNHKYALTGSIFSNDKNIISKSNQYFKESCGNFYINEKSTGAVVGQQPFGGMKLSGTNDKAGDINFLYKLFNQRNLKFNNQIKLN